MSEPPVRIAIDCTPLLGSPTGVGTFVRGALHGVCASPRAPRLVAFALSWRGRHDLAGAVPRGVDVASSGLPATAMLRLWRATDHPVIEAFTGPVEVVHGTNFVVPPARRAARVVTVHDLTAWRFPELCDPTSLRYPELVRRAVERGAFVHTPTAAVADELSAELDVPRERIAAIHHGVDGALPGDAARGRAIAGSSRFVLALGTVEPRKDLPLLVRAHERVASSADVDLVIAGADGWGAQALDDATAASGERARIRRVGYVGPHQRSDLLAAASVFAYPSRYEGFGLPPLEAMAMGVPVVTTDVPAVVEVVADAAIVVPRGDVEALADALVRAAGPERSSLVARGSTRAAGFTWNECASSLIDLYERAARAR